MLPSLPLHRAPSPQSLHSQWSDSNPGGATIPLHKLGNPLSKFLHNRQVLGIIRRFRSSPLSKDILDVLTCYLEAGEIVAATKIPILRELSHRAQVEAQVMIQCNVHHTLVYLLDSPNADIIELPMLRHSAANVNRQAIYALNRIGKRSVEGARALMETNVGPLAVIILESEDDDILEWTCEMLGDIARHVKLLDAPNINVLLLTCRILGKIASHWQIPLTRRAAELESCKALILILGYQDPQGGPYSIPSLPLQRWIKYNSDLVLDLLHSPDIATVQSICHGLTKNEALGKIWRISCPTSSETSLERHQRLGNWSTHGSTGANSLYATCGDPVLLPSQKQRFIAPRASKSVPEPSLKGIPVGDEQYLVYPTQLQEQYVGGPSRPVIYNHGTMRGPPSPHPGVFKCRDESGKNAHESKHADDLLCVQFSIEMDNFLPSLFIAAASTLFVRATTAPPPGTVGKFCDFQGRFINVISPQLAGLSPVQGWTDSSNLTVQWFILAPFNEPGIHSQVVASQLFAGQLIETQTGLAVTSWPVGLGNTNPLTLEQPNAADSHQIFKVVAGLSVLFEELICSRNPCPLTKYELDTSLSSSGLHGFERDLQKDLEVS
ncbi:hypothetical protein B0H19DRAFT_1066392 [Mycena capillaripes]|nr:hypothetical protein B0H19DRAFT_1066392 [Mycena capillaripes]